jgi:hypothetical protein
MFYADQIGLDTVLAGLQKYGKGRRAEDFAPSALLKKLAESGGTFAAWAASKNAKSS